MKKKVLLTLTAGLSVLVFSSYKNGAYNGGAGNRTGSAGSTATCSGSGCHSNNTSNTHITLTLNDGTNNVTSYIGGHTYTITLAGTNTTSGLIKFGFQISAVMAANTSAQAGSFATGGTSGIAIRGISGGLSLVEHSTPLSEASGSTTNNNIYSVTFQWTAPASGSGAVQFFAMLNAVNNSNSESGDQPNSFTTTINEMPAGVAELSQHIKITAYPNPALNNVNLNFEDAQPGIYTIRAFNVAGQVMGQQSIQVNGSGNLANISTTTWASGMYYIQVMHNNAQRVLTVIKQ